MINNTYLDVPKKQISEIIIVTNPAIGTGVERVQKELIAEWEKNNISINVIQIVDDLNRSDKVNNYLKNDKEVIIKCLEKNKFVRFINKYIEVRRIINNHPNAVIIAMTGPAVNLMCILSIFIRNKVIVSERNDPANYPIKKIDRIIRNIAFLFPDLCIFQTEQAKQYFCKITQKKGFVISNPINPALPEVWRGIRRKTIVAVGRLHQQKNYSMMLSSFKLFLEKYPEYTLEIFGDGVLKIELKEMTKKLKIENNVKFMGYNNDIYNYIKDASIYISSSDYEGISNSMLESMALGLPVICTDCPAGGAREMIENNINGLLIPVGDVDALFEAMCKVAGDQKFAESLGQNALKIREKYPIEKIAQQWIDVMQ